jgi:Ca-activated chloride channel family protein
MKSPVRRAVRRRGWLALAVSLALHGGLVWALTLLPGAGARLAAPEAGPVGLDLVQEGAEDEGTSFLVPQPGPGGPQPAQAAKSASEDGAGPEVAVNHSPESIVPIAHQPEQSPGTALVDPAVFSQAGGPGEGTGAGHEGGGGGTTAFFAIGTQARSVVYVIDRSASMGPGGLLAAAVRELCASLARLPAATRFQVVVYHDQPALLLPGRAQLVPASPDNTERAARLLKGLQAEGGTNHLRALQLALSLAPEVVYLLTDADDLSDADRQKVTYNNRGRAVIHTIELNTSNRHRADMPLQVLARENRGRYMAVDLRR